MSYLLFNASRDDFDDGQGNEVSLGEHLDYLANAGGTPDCWSSVEGNSRVDALNKARESGLHLYIVDESMLRVVGEVNKPT
jgi:hypothetical protein